MMSARTMEYRTGRQRLVEQLIAITTLASGLLLFGSYLPELVIAGLAASVVWSMGTR